MKKIRIYISGPISGRPKEEYLAHFAEAAASLHTQGFKPVNPTTMFGIFQPIFNRVPYKYQVLIDCLALARCQRIYLLSGWSHSRGARLERTIAAWLDIPASNEPVR